MQVAVIFGIAGACRREELCQMTLDDIDDVGSALIVKVRNTKNKIDRIFTVLNNEEITVNFLQLFRKYLSLRPSHTKHRRLFVFYKNGKCTSQVVGKNILGQVPKKVATFLKLPDTCTYTGHCLRRSSATLLANEGADLINIKRHGGWKSSVVAESYIEDSLNNKMKIAKQVLIGGDAVVPSTSKGSSSNEFVNSIPCGFNINNCNECKIDITVHVNK